MKNKFASLAFGLALSAWSVSGAAAQDGSAVAQMGIKYPEPATIPGPAVSSPPRVIGEAATPHDHNKGLPPIPVGTGTLPQPASPPTGPVSPVGPAAPCDLVFFQHSVVKPTGASTSLVGEPSVAQCRDTILQTGNWYAARSLDSGETWTHISPYTTFSATDGGFCCDQRAIYIPSVDITVWLLQYTYSSTTQQGGQRIAIANGRADLRAGNNGSWHSYYFDPRDFGRPAGEWLDFPDIAYSNGHLYCASNIFNAAGSFTDAVVWRMPLSQLAAGGTVNFGYARSSSALSGGSSYRLTQNAGATMYFARHVSTTQLRAYRWPDSSSTISWTNITVPDWSSTTGYRANAPNGINWAGRADSRITGAYYKSGEYGFMWHCGPRSGRPQVYVRTARINSSTNALIATEDTWSETLQFMYPAAATNSSGDIGCCAAVADSSSLHPTTCYFIVDSCRPNFHGQTVTWFTGNASPSTASRWGDYFSIQRHSHYPATFVATGMTCRSGGANGNSEPHYVWFCREQTQPPVVTLTVQSTPVTGIPITVDVADRAGLRNGSTNFVRNYNPRQGYQLTAPLSHTSGSTVYVFDRWVLNGAPQTLNQRVLNVDDIGVAADTAVAEFKIRRTLQVRSSNPASGISITVGTPDINNNQNGTTPFDRLYKDGTTVSLVAPAMNGIHPFKQWVLDGVNQPLGQTTINVSINGTRTATAIYYTHVNGSFTAFCSGCPGTGNQVPVHSGSGIPEIGNVVTWRVTNARPLSGGTLYLGASRTFFNGIPLPLNLGFLGMGASCRLCVSVDVSLAFATNSSGTATVNVPIPNNVALIQGSLFTQPAVVDIGAGTTVPIVHGNALETRLGGNL